jgi:copper transport protein
MLRQARWLLAVATTMVAGLVVVPTAGAHAVLERTEPARGTVVEESPTRVVLGFDEPVEGALGSVRVFDGSGERVDGEEVTKPSREEIAVAIDGELERGTYTVAWRVISADSDPINGAWVFHVQEPGPQPTGIAAQVLEDTPLVTSAFYTGGRFFEFAFLLLCAGGVAALIYALRSADARLHRRLYGLLAAFAGALAVFTLLGIPFQGAAAAGTSLGEAFRWDVVSSVVETRYGKVELIRAGLAVTLMAVALFLRGATGTAREAGNAGAAVLAAGLVMTPSFAGHASVAGGLAIFSDIAHVLAAAAWVGGLAFVIVGLALALENRWPLATRCVPRFSLMAVGAVGLLLAAGVVNGFLQVRTWRGLWETDYGLLLLAKVALVLPLLALGAYNNRYAVPRLRAGVAEPRERRRFLQAASFELVVMVAIIGVTAVLVNAAPAKDIVMEHGAATAEVDLGGEVQAHVSVEPGTTGRNDIHIELGGHEAAAEEVAEVNVAITLPSQGVGPLRYKAEPDGHAGYVVRDAEFGIAGEWELRVEARRGEFELLTGLATIMIE